MKTLAGWTALACLISLVRLEHPIRIIPAPAEPYFEPGACLFPAPGDGRTECGFLTVPENRSEPEGRGVRLPVVIFKSHSENPEPDPVVFFDGGPGNSVLALAGLFAASPIRRNRDLILLEQRGNNGAEPSLDCPEVDRAILSNLSSAGTVEEETRRVAEAAGICRERLTSQVGIDLSQYHSAAAAADFEDLRRILGYEQWNLYGVSYGTRLAMFYMRDYPAHVRSVVLDSIYPPETDTYSQLVPQAIEVFGSLFDACAQDVRCREAYPCLEEHFYRLVEELNDDPVPLRAGAIDVLFNGDDLVATVFNALYDTSAVPLLPLLIEEIQQGNAGVLAPIVSGAVGQLTGINWGKYYSVECYEEWPFNPPEAVADSFARNPQISIFIPFAYDLGVCPVWNIGRAPDDADRPVASDLPTLILSGELDPITRPEFGRTAAESLGRAYRYEFPGQAHAISLSGCAQRMMLDFLDDPSVPPDEDCMADLARAPFIIAEDWHLTPALYRLNADLLGRPNPVHRGLLGFMLLFFLGEILLLPGNLIRALRRRSPASPAPARIARGLGLAVAVLGAAFWLGLAAAVGRILSDGFLMLGFGVPREYGWILALPRSAVLPAFGMAALAVPVWRCGYWTALVRVHYTLLTLAAWVFVFFTWYWGLMG
ncbi:MAG: alpha/beta fold hydrolase [Anaerolineales bacterium]|nr:alpha/beta fold hydrolase [Anaerolineales bacterium]